MLKLISAGLAATIINYFGSLASAQPATTSALPPPSSAAPDALRCPHIAVITNAKWKKLPSATDLERAYPSAAHKAHLADRVRMTCKVADDGGLYDCQIVSDQVPGQGFDAAALSLAPKFRVELPPSSRPPELPARCPWSPQTDGPARVTIPLTFNGD